LFRNGGPARPDPFFAGQGRGGPKRAELTRFVTPKYINMVLQKIRQ